MADPRRSARIGIVAGLSFPFILIGALSPTIQVDAADKTQGDVLVVGAGISGLSAALEAGRGGARVTVIELSSVFGGHAVVSGGNVCIVDTPLQHQQKINDSAELAYKDFTRWGEDADTGWVRYYVDNSRKDIYDWSTSLGINFDFLIPHDGNSVPRLHAARGKGLGLVSPIYRACLGNPNITFVWNTKLTDLIVENKQITGLVAENLRTGKRQRFRAGAIILATGGFQSNLEMVRDFWPQYLPVPKRLLAGAGQHALGSGHEIASNAGAVLHNRDHQWNYAIGLPDPRDPSGRRGFASFNPASIWVNLKGKRFVNEFAGAKDSLPAMLAQEGTTYFAIFDEAGKKSFSVTLAGWNDFALIQKLIFDNPKLVQSAPTLEELASKVGMPGAALSETVTRYNRMIDESSDKDFGRSLSRSTPRIITPPFYAVQFFPITRKSMGGVRVDQRCRVLDRQNQAIPGLYAVGELTGFAGINGKAALEGTFLGPSIVMGRVAARDIISTLKTRQLLLPLLKTPGTEKVSPSQKPAVENKECLSCHKVSKELAESRNGFWHYLKSHRVILDRGLQCVSCHLELAPYRPKSHRIDRLAQVENCVFCHGLQRN